MNWRFTLFLVLFCTLFIGFKLYQAGGSVARTADAPAAEPSLASEPARQGDQNPASEVDNASESDAAAEAEAQQSGDPAWNRYARAKKAWQLALQKLVVQERPEFEKVAAVNLRLQFLLIDLRTRRFEYLLKHDPQRLHRNRGLASFVNFDWSQNDTFALRAADPQAKQLESRIRAARRSRSRGRDWPQMARFIQEHLSHTERFKAEAAKYRAACGEVETLLAKSAPPPVETSIVPAVQVQTLLPGTERLVAGLAVKASNGLIYFTDAKDGRAIIFDLQGRGPAAHVWSIKSENERLEIAGLDRQSLIVVFNDGAPFTRPEQAWQPGVAYFRLKLGSPGLGLEPIQISADVRHALLQKCKAPRPWQEPEA